MPALPIIDWLLMDYAYPALLKLGELCTASEHAVPQELALDAVTCVMSDVSGGQREIDIKKYVKIEKIPGGAIEDCRYEFLLSNQGRPSPLSGCFNT